MTRTFSGEKLQALRRARGMSRTELAAAVGRGMDTVGMWERGTNEPQLAAFYALQTVLGCQADDLLTDDDPAGEAPGRRTAVSLGTSTGSRVGRDRRVER